MNKLWLITRREYLTRVTKRSFILATLLTPLIIIAFIVIVGLIFSYQGGKTRIAIVNDSGVTMNIPDTKKLYFIEVDKPLEEIKTSYQEEDYEGVLYIPKYKNLNQTELPVQYYSEQQLSLTTKETIASRLGKKIRAQKMLKAGISQAALDSLNTKIAIKETSITVSDAGEIEETEKESSAEIATILGTIMGFFIYMVMFIYGSMVMRSVMEEKMNRIVEVVISSVKPFQLMLGKILGVGAVGLTQLLFWLITIPVLQMILGLFWSPDTASIEAMQGANGPDPDDMMAKIQHIMDLVAAQNWVLIIPLFIFFFLGGFLLYSSLFAAVGSAIGDDLGESQSLTLPITIPVILAIYIMFAVIDNPNSGLATFASIFPLFSPIVMPARLAFNPPMWEILVSIVVMIISVIFFIWLSGRIYRVGILMYGKKVTFRELGKWLFYKD